MDRLPQAGDRVEILTCDEFGTVVPNVAPRLEDETWSFFVEDDRKFRGWYEADELRVVGGAPASDPANYRH